MMVCTGWDDMLKCLFLFHPVTESLNTQYDEEAINTALQRLAMRQQQRQYTANNASNVLSQSKEGAIVSGSHNRKQSWGSTGNSELSGQHHRVQSNVEYYHHAQGSNEDNNRKPPRGQSANSRSQSHENLHHEGRRAQTATHSRTRSISSASKRSDHHKHHRKSSYSEQEEPRSANDTFNSFIHDGGESGIVSRPDSRTGPSKGSAHHQQVTSQMMKQQKMMEASRSLLEQSKAKHQAMVAQAHAAQKSKLDSNSAYGGSQEGVNNFGSQELAPKPPLNSSSNKKPTSSHRLARYVWT